MTRYFHEPHPVKRKIHLPLFYIQIQTVHIIGRVSLGTFNHIKEEKETNNVNS